jgi:hypothetical protein
MENIIVQGLGFEISEDKSNPDYLQGRFCICDFDVNKNGVSLNRETIEQWVSTLVGTPLVAKITKNIKGNNDFGSHEMRVVSFKDKKGKVHKKAVFDTSAFGVCTDVSIETADDGNDYIYATYKIWKRFENACKIIQERAENLKTSWEICTEEFTQKIQNAQVVKEINKGRFIGLAMLGDAIPPAYDSSGLLEVASEQDDELNIALMEDLENLNVSSNINTEEKEVTEMDENKIEVNTAQTSEEVVDNVETSENIENTKTEQTVVEQVEEPTVSEVVVEKSEDDNIESDNDVEASALTERDLKRRLEKAFEQADENGHCTYGYMMMLFPADSTAWFRECCQKSELDLVEVKYTVENDNVTITEKNPVTLTVSPREINQIVAQKDNAIVEMSAQIQSLNDKVSELQPYKDKVDEIEKAEREAQLEKDKKELSEYAVSSGYITQEELETSEEIKGYIEKLDKASIKSIISDRVVASLTQKTEEVETSEANVETESEIQINLSAEKDEDVKLDTKTANSIMKAFLARKNK